MSDNILVSCVMANYNTDINMLKASIDSILNQTYKCLEIIIIDDSSTNGSYELIKEYAKKDRRVIVKKNKKNMGLPYSLNRAIELAKGKYIARMDTDDISLPDRFKIQVNFMEKNLQIGICGSFAKVFGTQNYINFTPLCSPNEVKCQLMFSATLIHPTVMFRKEFIDKYNIKYNEDYKCSQDFELWSRAVDLTNIAIINRVLLYYRSHPTQASSQKKEMQRNYAIEICKNSLKALNIEIAEDKIKYHLMLCGKEKINYDDINDILTLIANIIEKNSSTLLYDSKTLKKVIYNRLFNIILKSDIKLTQKLKAVLFTKRINSLYNYYYLIIRLYYLAVLNIREKGVKHEHLY